MFDEELRRVEETRPPCILLDLRELAAQRRARRAGRRLLLVCGGRAIQRLLALTAVNAACEIVGDIPIELRTQPAGENSRRSGSAPTSACSAGTHGLSAVRLSRNANGRDRRQPGGDDRVSARMAASVTLPAGAVPGET